MIPAWLKDKQPEDLPNLETVMDIFVELEDTKKYSIKSLRFDYDSKRPDINFNDVYYANYCYAKLIDDPDHSEDEERFILLGLSSSLRVMIVCHCYRSSGNVIRIISARKATTKEAKFYS